MKRFLGIFLLVSVAAPAFATPTALTIDTTQSNVNVTLCLTACSTQCGTDTSPVAGSITLSPDCLTNPTALTLFDYTLQLSRSMAFHLNYGPFCGRFDATTSNVAFNYATPGTPQPPTSLSGGSFSYANVSQNSSGTLSYSSTNLVCAGLQANGRPCNDTIDLSTLGTGSVTFNGTFSASNRTLTVILNINSSAPIDPNNPGLGTLTTVGTIKASGVVPLPSIDDFVGVLTGTVTAQDLICESDINQDGLTDGRDVSAYVHALLGG
jgi:hypothetical protein